MAATGSLAPTLRVRGLSQTIRAFSVLEKGVRAEILGELKSIAEPVAREAQDLLSEYQGLSIRTIRPRSSVRGAFVTQGAKKVTGRRPDFGALQMREGLIPALEAHEPDLEPKVGEALDRLTRAAGFI